MLTESTRDYASMSSIGASIIFADAMKKLARGERYNLGLATGNTMITLYAELAEKFNSAKADLSLLSTWNLDEYAVDEHTPVRHDHPLSCWKYMHEMFFSKLDPALGFKEENAHLLDSSHSGASGEFGQWRTVREERGCGEASPRACRPVKGVRRWNG